MGHCLRSRFYFFFLGFLTLVFFPLSRGELLAQENFIGRLKYNGGDWYSNPSSLPNLLQFFSQTTRARTVKREIVVSLADESFKKVPIIYFTGHGLFKLEEKEKENLRWFLKNGGFLFADDNFGMDRYIRQELNSLFIGVQLQELPFQHPVFKYPFDFSAGVPKIHEHYGGVPRSYGLFLNGRMVAFYAYNTDLGDGWEDTDVHNTPLVKQQSALKMGTNVLWYALNGGLSGK